MDFSEALKLIVSGSKVRRAIWKNVTCVFLVDGSTFQVNRPPLSKIFAEGTEVNYMPHIDMIGADGKVGVWTASTGDILGTDWEVVPTL